MPRVRCQSCYDSESNLASLDIEACVSRIPLREDCLFLGKSHDVPTLADSGKEFLWVEVALFLARHGLVPSHLQTFKEKLEKISEINREPLRRERAR